MNFAKFLITTILKNICERLLLSFVLLLLSVDYKESLTLEGSKNGKYNVIFGLYYNFLGFVLIANVNFASVVQTVYLINQSIEHKQNSNRITTD